jgi:cytochrome c-type biogenesis protein
MFEADITIWTAFFAGVLSFISPCVLPLVPPYMSYLAGANLAAASTGEDGEAARVDMTRVLTIALLFVLGFSTVFVALGASASAIGQLLRAYMDILQKLAGVVIIIMGLHFTGIFRIGFLMMEKRLQVDAKPATYLGAYVMGFAFALGWTPCIGPVLATILAIAAQEESVAKGALLLSIYSAGLGIPFLTAAAAMGPFMAFLKRFRRHMHKVEIIMGVFLIITGLLFLTGGIQTISVWLIETFPSLAEVG